MTNNDPHNVTDVEMYSVINDCIINAEHHRQGRFNTFLLFNSICILAWVGLATLIPAAPIPASDASISDSAGNFARIIMTIISGLGMFWGLTWSWVGVRSSLFVRFYTELARQKEQKMSSSIKP